MKKHYILIFILSFTLQVLAAQTIWTGPKITFTKANYADWTQEANQDRITDNVWITRADTESIFNIVVESSYEDSVSPKNTEWAFGQTSDGISTLTFYPFDTLLVDGVGNDILNHSNYVLHLISEDIYIDLSFLSWTKGPNSGGGGGGFSYERSTPAILGTGEKNLKQVSIFPNPARDIINIKELKTDDSYKIYSLLGEVVHEGKVKRGDKQIHIDKLSKGVYVLKLKDKTTIKFIKQ